MPSQIRRTNRVLALFLALPIAQAMPVEPENPVFSPLPDQEEGSPETIDATDTDTTDIDPGAETRPSEPASVPSPHLPAAETVVPELLPATERSPVVIALPELIELAISGNRDLRDEQIQRLLQRQQLQAAEEQFDPQITPAIGVGISQSLYSGAPIAGNLPGSIGGTSDELGDRTTLTQSAGLLGEVTTRYGTDLSLTLDALGDTPIGLQFTQPLVRGAGTDVNEAPVAIARLTETQNGLALQATLIDTVSTTITQYTSLIDAQESVIIQTQALERRRERLSITTALVEAGRRARIDLVDARRSVADAERDLLVAQTSLAAANTALLDQIGTERPILFVASSDAIAELFTAAEARVEGLEVERLVAIAYQQRPDYRQAQLDPDVAQLNLRLAEDDLRWQLNLEGDANLGDFSQTTLGLVARRTLDEPELHTALTSSQIAILQAENRLAQLETTIRNDITNQLNTVQTNLARVEAAQRATENARLQLEVTQELFRRGRSGADIFRIITQEENLVEAQNQRLSAEIEFLNSLVDLDQAVGITLDTWGQAVNFAPALVTPDAIDLTIPIK